MRQSRLLFGQSLPVPRRVDLDVLLRIRNKSAHLRKTKIYFILILVTLMFFLQQRLYRRETDVTLLSTRKTSDGLADKDKVGSGKDSSSEPIQAVTVRLKSKEEEVLRIRYDAFNNTNPHAKSWCPYALCRNSPLCTPCNRRYLFIITNGRSGSTTLLKMLNLLPGIRLSGENNGVMVSAASLERNLGGVEDLLGQRNDVRDGAWMHNGIPAGALACSMQQIINTINPPPYRVQRRVNVTGSPSIQEYDRFKILGMKTVRIGDSKLWDAKAVSNFFQTNFPCSKIVVNIRSERKKQVMSSMRASWKESNQTEIEERLRHSQGFLKEFYHELGPNRAILIDMKEWTKDISVFNAMVKWLGFENCEFKALLRENFNRYQHDTTTDPGLDLDKCKAI